MTDNRIRADPEFIKMVKINAACEGISVREYTKRLAKSHSVSDRLPLNVKSDEKKGFFKIGF